jgi:hypothetical protein
MRRFTTAVSAAALSLSMALSLNLGTAQAATPGYDSAYQFESAFLTLKVGDNGTFSVFFANTGTTAWTAGAGTQVNLAVCAADKVTCNVPSANAAWAQGWLSTTAYATHTKTVVVPGDFSAFTYNVKAPLGAAAGTYRFNGDLVVASTGDRVHPEGYYQDSTIGTQAGGAPITAAPAFATDSANEVSGTVPGSGQHTITFQTTGLSGTLNFAIIASGNVNQNADGTYSFCDTNQDSKGDLSDPGTSAGGTTGMNNANTFFTAVNGKSIGQSSTVVNEPIPANGQITVTIDSAKRNQRVRVVAWQDNNQNSQIDLIGAGDVNCDAFTAYSTTDGAIAVSGRKFYTGPNGTFGLQFAGTTDASGNANCGYIFRYSGSLNMFTAGAGTVGTAGQGASDSSNRYNLDTNDIYRVNGVQVTQAQFKAAVSPSISGGGDTVGISYNPDAAGISEFNLCRNRGFLAPTITSTVGNFDNGTVAEDVRISFTAPSINTITTYSIQRSTIGTGNPPSTAVTATNCNSTGAAGTNPSGGTSDSAGVPAGTTFTTVGSVTVDPGKDGQFTNFDVPDGAYCYRVRTQDPTTGTFSYSNYVGATVPGSADALKPTSTSAILSVSSGFQNTLDSGDKLEINFTDTGCGTNCGMSVATNAVIRVMDSDCGVTGATGTGTNPAGTPNTTCSGNLTFTVADIVCGTNATCSLDTAKTKLTITMTSNPTIQAAGSSAGVSYPVRVTDSSGVTDLSGNQWDLAASTDAGTVIP